MLRQRNQMNLQKTIVKRKQIKYQRHHSLQTFLSEQTKCTILRQIDLLHNLVCYRFASYTRKYLLRHYFFIGFVAFKGSDCISFRSYIRAWLPNRTIQKSRVCYSIKNETQYLRPDLSKYFLKHWIQCF